MKSHFLKLFFFCLFYTTKLIAVDEYTGESSACPEGISIDYGTDDFSYHVIENTMPFYGNYLDTSYDHDHWGTWYQLEYAVQVMNKNTSKMRMPPLKKVIDNRFDSRYGFPLNHSFVDRIPSVDPGDDNYDNIIDDHAEIVRRDLLGLHKRMILFTDDPTFFDITDYLEDEPSQIGQAFLIGDIVDCKSERGVILFRRTKDCSEGSAAVQANCGIDSSVVSPEILYHYKNTSFWAWRNDKNVASPWASLRELALVDYSPSLVPVAMHEILHHWGLKHPSAIQLVSGLSGHGDNYGTMQGDEKGSYLSNGDLYSSLRFFMTEYESSLLSIKHGFNDEIANIEISVEPWVFHRVNENDSGRYSSNQEGEIISNGSTQDLCEPSPGSPNCREVIAGKTATVEFNYHLQAKEILGPEIQVKYKMILSEDSYISPNNLQDIVLDEGYIGLRQDVPEKVTHTVTIPDMPNGTRAFLGVYIDPDNEILEYSSLDNAANYEIVILNISNPIGSVPGWETQGDECVHGATANRLVYPVPSIPQGSPEPEKILQPGTCVNGYWEWLDGPYYLELVYSSVSLSGVVYGNYSSENNPIVISGDIIVPEGENLTFENGALIAVAGDFTIDVYGSININGYQETVVLSSLNVGENWRGITFHTDSSGWIGGAVIADAKKTGNGGAVFVNTNNGVAIDNSEFVDNYAGGDGGAIYFNQNYQGPWMYYYSNNNFINNTAEGKGGAVAFAPLAINDTQYLMSNTFKGNKAAYGGAVAQIGTSSNIIFANNHFYENVASMESGAIYCDPSSPKISFDSEEGENIFENNIPNTYSQRCFSTSPEKFHQMIDQNYLDIIFDNYSSKYIEFSVLKDSLLSLTITSSIDSTYEIRQSTSEGNVVKSTTSIDNTTHDLGFFAAGVYLLEITRINNNENGELSVSLEFEDTNCGSWKSGEIVSSTRFLDNRVDFGETCTSVEVTGVCQQGTIIWDDTSLHDECIENEPERCFTPNGELISHNDIAIRTGYESELVPAGNSCQIIEQEGICYNGNIQWNGTKPYDFCTVEDSGDYIQEGQVLAGNLDYGEVKTYYFDIFDSDVYKFYTQSNLDLVIEIYDSNMNIISADDDDGENKNSRIEEKLDTGSYSLQVRGYNSYVSGNFNIRLERPRSSALGMSIPSTTSNEILNLGSSQYYLLEHTDANQNISIYTESDLDLYMRVFDTNGNLLVTDDDSGSGKNPLLNGLFNPGIYLIQITGYYSAIYGNFEVIIDY